MEITYICALLLSLNNLHSIIYTLEPVFLFILYLFNIRLFRITNTDKINHSFLRLLRKEIGYQKMALLSNSYINNKF